MANERLHSTLQENLITLLCYDDKAGKIVASMIDPTLFEGEYRSIAEKAIEFWGRFKEAPKDHTPDLVAHVLEDPHNRKANTYKRILRNMSSLSEGINTEYVLHELRIFRRLQLMKSSILEAAERINRGDDLAINEVEEMLATLLAARNYAFDPGMNLHEVDRMLESETGPSEFRLGIKEFDRYNIGPARGKLMNILAPTGKGKTWALVHAGKHALLQRKKVLHISLEMGEEEVAGRYYQSLFSVSKRHDVYKVATLEIDDDGKWPELTGIGEEEITPTFSLDSKIIRDELFNHLGPDTGKFSNLRIKRFPPRGLTVNGLRAYLDALEMTEGFIPDMLIIDYIGIMWTDPKNPRVSLGRTYEEVRALLVERNMAGVTAAQVGRAGADATQVHATMVSEDYSMIMTCELVITYSSTDAEHALGLARLFVDKFRSDKDKIGVIITQRYEVGQFVIDSAPLRREYFSFVKEADPDAFREDDEE